MPSWSCLPVAVDARLLAHQDLEFVQELVDVMAFVALADRLELAGQRFGLRGDLGVLRSGESASGDELGGRNAGDLAEDDRVEQGIAAEPVRPMDADAGAFARRVEAFDRGSAVLVDVDPAHGVVLGRLDGDRRVDGIDPAKWMQISWMPGSRLSIFSRPRWRRSRWTYAFSKPLPLRISVVIDAGDDVARGELHGLRARSPP